MSKPTRKAGSGRRLGAFVGAFLGLCLSLAGGTDVAAQDADERAAAIAEELDRIESLLGVQPENALAAITTQRRALLDLGEQAPQHPRLDELGERIVAIEERLADPEAAAQVVAPPVDVDRTITRLRERLREAESALMSRDVNRAEPLLVEVETDLETLKRDHAEDIPQSHVALFVLEERLDVLKKQAAETEQR
jgi:hypothetical protein